MPRHRDDDPETRCRGQVRDRIKDRLVKLAKIATDHTGERLPYLDTLDQIRDERPISSVRLAQDIGVNDIISILNQGDLNEFTTRDLVMVELGATATMIATHEREAVVEDEGRPYVPPGMPAATTQVTAGQLTGGTSAGRATGPIQ